MSTPTDLVVLGGTFDPFTLGHLAVAQQLHEALAALVLIVPAQTPPLRAPTRAPFADRVEMCRVSIAGIEGLEISDIERGRPGISYALLTMQDLQTKFPNNLLWAAIGADAARGIRDWHRFQQLLDQFHFVLFNRAQNGEPDLSVPEGDFPSERTRRLQIASPQVSATEVRHLVQTGREYAQLVAAGVAEIIEERGLYRE